MTKPAEIYAKIISLDIIKKIPLLLTCAEKTSSKEFSVAASCLSRFEFMFQGFCNLTKGSKTDVYLMNHFADVEKKYKSGTYDNSFPLEEFVKSTLLEQFHGAYVEILNKLLFAHSLMKTVNEKSNVFFENCERGLKLKDTFVKELAELTAKFEKI